MRMFYVRRFSAAIAQHSTAAKNRLRFHHHPLPASNGASSLCDVCRLSNRANMNAKIDNLISCARFIMAFAQRRAANSGNNVRMSIFISRNVNVLNAQRSTLNVAPGR